MKIRQQANRGRPLETLVEVANAQYRGRKMAVIHKVPTAWMPLRDGETGKITSAKVEAKAAVDFLGAYNARAIAFDAKHAAGHRIRWDRLEAHQAQFLQDWVTVGGLGYVLVSFDLRRSFLVPWWFWAAGLAVWREGGPASIAADDIPAEYEVKRTARRVTLDYLAVVDGLAEGGLPGGPSGEVASHGSGQPAGCRRVRVDRCEHPDVAVASAGSRRSARPRSGAGGRRSQAE